MERIEHDIEVSEEHIEISLRVLGQLLYWSGKMTIGVAKQLHTAMENALRDHHDQFEKGSNDDSTEDPPEDSGA